VPTVRSWDVRDAAVSTVNAVAASSTPASSAIVRAARKRSCDQASRPNAAVSPRARLPDPHRAEVPDLL
jgi:hypothetical protein